MSEEMENIDLEAFLNDDDFTDTQQNTTNAQEPNNSHLDTLKKYFGHASFRPSQWKIIHSVMIERKDNCVVMATGYGKSLCYQYPAVYQNGLSIVISPLISLMEDQVQSLEVTNIPACFLGSAQTKSSEIKQNLIEGFYRIVYMAPEYASSDQGFALIQDLYSQGNIVLIAIDEAHCVSQWGHDFRPAYRSLNKIRTCAPSTPILALTATATEDVTKDIIKSLGLRSPHTLCTGFDRPNLYFKAEKKSKDIYSDIMKAIKSENKSFNIEKGSIIIYCLTKKNTEDIADLLKSKGIKCEAYHAGLSLKKRKHAHELFVKDEIKIIIATIAFGMGIDKPNVRCVIHYGSSSEMERYYQEAGRAGRDGNPSLCILYHSGQDFFIHDFLLQKSHMSSSSKSHKEALNNIMQQYVNSRVCRRHLIMSYFDKTIIAPSEPRENCCDNCTKKLTPTNNSIIYEGINGEGLYDFTDDTEKFLNAIKCFSPKTFGVTMIIALLKGSKSKKLNSSYMTSKIYGAGSNKSESWWKEIALILEQEGYIKKEKISSSKFSVSVIVLDSKGENWLRDKAENKGSPVMIAPTDDIIKTLKIKGNVQENEGRVKPLYLNNWISTTNSDMKNNSQEPSILNNIPICDQLQSYEQNLLDMLFTLRHDLAKQSDIMPHVVASDIALHQLAKKQPKSKVQLIKGNFDGLSEMKIEKFGRQILKKINEYCNENVKPVKNIGEILNMYPLPPSACSQLNAMSSTHKITIDLFIEGKCPEDIAATRKLAPSTIITHLCCGLRLSDSMDISRLITAPKLFRIIEAIKADPINNDVSKLAPIKNQCPPVITYDEIKIAISYLEVRNHCNSINIAYNDRYALASEEEKYYFKTSIVQPTQNIDNEEDLNVTNLASVEPVEINENPHIDLVEDLSQVAISSLEEIKIKSNLNECNKNDPHQTVAEEKSNIWSEDEIFNNNFNTIDEIINVHDLDEIENIEPNKNENLDVQSNEINPASLKNHDTQISSSPTSSMDKVDSDFNDSVQNNNAVKRKLPNWMENTTEAKNIMRSKMSKNSLFN